MATDLIITNKANINAIADAVRTQNGTTEPMTMGEIVQGINNINKDHNHTIDEIINLQDSLDLKLDKNQGTENANKILVTDGNGKIIVDGNSTELIYKSNVLTKGANSEFTPTDNYHPATKKYVDDAKNDLLNGAGEAYDTLKELGDLIDENTNALEALNTVATNKADKDHNHNDIYCTKEQFSNTLLKTGQELTEDEINQIHTNLHTIDYVNNLFNSYAADIANLLGGIE